MTSARGAGGRGLGGWFGMKSRLDDVLVKYEKSRSIYLILIIIITFSPDVLFSRYQFDSSVYVTFFAKLCATP